MKTKAVPSTSTVPNAAPKLVFVYLIQLLKTLYTDSCFTIQDDRYACLLVRDQFNWCEDVENDIAMKTKAVAIDTNTPATDTDSLATAFTGPATDGKLVCIPTSILRISFRPQRLTMATLQDDDYAQVLVHHDCSDDAKNDIAVDTNDLAVISTGPAIIASKLVSIPTFTSAPVSFHTSVTYNAYTIGPRVL